MVITRGDEPTPGTSSAAGGIASKSAIHKRAAFKGQLTSFKRYVDELSEGDELTELRIRLKRMENLYDKFDEVQTEIEMEGQTNDEERSAFEKMYYSCIAKATNILEQNDERNSVSQSERSGVVSTPIGGEGEAVSTVKLPTLHLPTFCGGFDDWLGFHGSFKAVIHDNSKLPPIQKLQYLRSCVRDDAARTIEALDTTAESYGIAWQLLNERYDNRRVIIQTHTRKLFELPVVARDAKSLRSLVDEVLKHTRALKNLGQPTDQWSTPLVWAVTSKIDKETLQEWEKRCVGNDEPKFEALVAFLKERCQLLETMQHRAVTNKGAFVPVASNKQSPTTRAEAKPRAQTFVGTEGSSNLCALCSNEHAIRDCGQFLRLSVDERVQTVKKIGLCYNCLKGKHLANVCRASSCRKCQRRHHTLLHNDHIQKQSPNTEEKSDSMKSLHVTTLSQVLLSTAIVDVIGSDGKTHACRTLLDSASQANFIRADFVRKLGLPERPINIPVNGLSEMEKCIKRSAQAQVRSRIGNFSETLDFLVTGVITDKIPTQQVDKTKLSIAPNIKLADPEFATPGKIDMLLGAEIFYKLLCIGQLSLPRGAVLQKTRLGWVVSGRIGTVNNLTKASCHLSTMQLEDRLTRFWEIEEIPDVKLWSEEEMKCEMHFRENTTRTPGGRYIVRLPFNEKKELLGDSKFRARERFFQLERKLSKNPDLKQHYIEFMREYEEMGHMSLIRDDKMTSDGFFLPHHAVVKETSATTKTRVVFDASAKTESGLSLNDTLQVGPVIQEDVFAIVSRFRKHTYAMTADVAKMYRQVLVHPEDRKFQRIFWREASDLPLKVYELNTVTYGTASASFLATRALQQLAEDERDNFPIAASIVKRDFYVDDLLTGANTIDEARPMRKDIVELTRRGGFQLRKWLSNETHIIDESFDCPIDVHVLDNTNSQKTLGLQWHAFEDVITYTVNVKERNVPVTKRSILSQIAKLYDPLGLLGPVIVVAKMIMKSLWQEGMQWDEVTSPHLHSRYVKYHEQLSLLNNWKVPRQIITPAAIKIQLHGFADASERAYGACVYIRSTDAHGRHQCNLVASKSRVAPAKPTTLPRLELCAATLLAKLIKTLNTALRLSFDSQYFWSDSTIVLSWIRTPPHTLKTFVANRVVEVNDVIPKEYWRHVPSEGNPADCLSRGQDVELFVQNKVWIHGPLWLTEEEEEWPPQPEVLDDPPEMRPSVSLTVTTAENITVRYSSVSKLLRVLAYCLRFVHNSRTVTRVGNSRLSGVLSVEERKRAMVALLRLVQGQEFGQEISLLGKGKTMSKGSRIYLLSPYIDENGLLRLGGRLARSALSVDQRHPIILPRNHALTKLIIRDIHERQMHSGINATLYGVRQNYWPVGGRMNVKQVLRQCVKCFKAKPTESAYVMGQLPRTRVTAQRPFETTGVDYCGPFFVKEKRHRNRNKIKVYACIFVCFTVKAVHVELAGDLTTETFLGCLKRFIARRGKPNIIYSDNGSNFVGAVREMRETMELIRSEAHNSRVKEFLAQQFIQWRFSPPRTPHFGGIWEAAVKSLKYHMRRTITDTLFTYEELSTFMVEAEAILNSRPLTPISSDPNDLTVLTPAHFLIGTSLTSIPESDVSDIQGNRLSSWQHVQAVKQRFWQRWHKEYLTEINRRVKWHDRTDSNIKIGTMVLLNDERLPPLHWKLGRVIEVHASEDGVIRVVTVKTANGVFKRGVRSIVILPIDDKAGDESG